MKYSKHIIAIDLDETLLNSDGKISEKNLHTLARCQSLGFTIAISTARGYGKTVKFAEAISADYICCHAGNMITDKNKNIIYKHAFSNKDVCDLIDHFSKYTNNFTIDSDFNLYGGLDDDFAHSWGVIHCPTEDLKSMTTYKICVGIDDSHKQELIDYCDSHNFVCREMRSGQLMIITPPDSDKYFALEQLMTILETDSSKLVVFGDDISDLISIQKAGFGVAMSNSRQEVLDHAQYVTLSNDEDGVSEFLQKMFKI